MGQYRTPDGVIVEEKDPVYAERLGYTPVSYEEQAAGSRVAGENLRNERLGNERGVLGSANVAASQFLSGVTLGLSDYALAGTMSQADRDQLLAEQQAHPIVSTGANITGMVAGAFADPASLLGRTPAGYLSRSAGAVIEGTQDAGTARRALTTVAASGAEAALQNAGQYLGHQALADADVTAEGLGGALGTGFEFGAIGGGAALGVEKGTIAARRMFSRVMDGGGNAVEDATIAWKRASADRLAADQATADIARRELDEIRAARNVAEGERMRADMQVRAEKSYQASAVDAATAARQAARDEQLASLGEIKTAAAPSIATTKDAVLAEEQALRAEASRKASFENQDKLRAERLPKEVAPITAEAAKPAVDIATNVEQAAPALTPGAEAMHRRLMKQQAEVAREMDVPEGATQAEFDAARNAAETRNAMFGTDSSVLGKKIAQREAELEKALADFEKAKPHILEHVQTAEAVKFSPPARGFVGENTMVSAPGLAVPTDFARRGIGQVRPGGIEPTAFLKQEGTAVAGPKAARGRLKALDAAHEAALETAGKATTQVARDAALQEAASIEAKLTHESLPDNAIGDIAKAAPAITDYEKASSKLADVVGEGAHPTSVEASDAFKKAQDDAVKKTMHRIGRAAQDAETFGPYEYPGPANASSAERVKYAQARKAEARAAYDQAKLAENAGQGRYDAAQAKLRETKLGAKASKPEASIKSKVGKAAGKGILGVAMLDELLDIPGLPKPHNLPVVGPLLGAYLKYRAVKGALGGFTGRVAATADSRVAALASKTRDRIATAVDRSLGLVAETAPKMRQPMVVVGAALAKRIYDDGAPPIPTDAPIQVQAAARMREIAAYVSHPTAIQDDVRRELRDVTDPDVIAAVEQHRMAAMQYVLSKMPMAPAPNPMSRKEWVPPVAAAYALGRRLAVIDDPPSAFEGADLTIEGAETARAVYPRLFEQAQGRLMTQMVDNSVSVPYATQQRLSLLYNVPLSTSMEGSRIRIVQDIYTPMPTQTSGPTSAPPVPSMAGNTALNALYQTSADRSALKR